MEKGKTVLIPGNKSIIMSFIASTESFFGVRIILFIL
jgi:hypothetical protein